MVVYPNDHRPAHVHVIGNGKEGVFFLHCPDGPPELRENWGLSTAEIRTVERAIADELTDYCEAWYGIHGYY